MLILNQLFFFEFFSINIFETNLFNNEFFSFGSEFFFLIILLFLLFIFIIITDSKLYKKPDSSLFALKLSIFFLFFLFFINYFFIEDIFESINFNFLFFQEPFNFIIKLFLIITLIFCFYMSISYIKFENFKTYEFSLLLLLSFFGTYLLLISNDFLSFYLAIEMQSLSFYILASLKKNSNFSTEAGLKYFILGAISSGFLLLGFSIIFGFSGCTNFFDLKLFYCFLNTPYYEYPVGIQTFICNLLEYSNIFGFVFILVGLFFKLGIFPFQIWVVDVYEGVPTIITAIFSTIPKIIFFILFLKFYLFTFSVPVLYFSTLKNVIFIFSIFSILIGSLGALFQTKIKRLFAYSAISHAGFLLLSISINTLSGVFSFFLYLIIYILLSLSFFLIYLNLRTFEFKFKIKKLSDLSNIAELNPTLSFCLLLVIFSIAGVPPLAGFFSKFFIFSALIEKSFYLISIIVILISVLSSFYYIRLIKTIYFSNKVKHISLYQISNADAFLISITVLLNVFFICFPSFFIDLAKTLSYLFLNRNFA